MTESQYPGPIEPELGRLLDDAKQHDALDAAFDEASAERALARVEQTTRERRLQRYRSLGIRSGVVLVSACLLATVAGSKLLGGRADPSPVAPTTPTSAPSEIVSPPSASPGAEGTPAPATPITTMHVDELPSSAHAPPPRAPARSTGSPLAEEYRLVDGARAKLASKDYAGALRSIREHRERFPSGQLNQECESLDIQILVETGRISEARERARSFSVRFPNGLLLPSVVDAIAGGAPDAARP